MARRFNGAISSHRFSKTASRVMAGVVAGLVLGTLSAIIGILLSGVVVSDAAMFNPMAKLVVLFAGVGAVVLACLFDFMYLYMRFLQCQETRWAHRVLGKARDPGR